MKKTFENMLAASVEVANSVKEGNENANNTTVANTITIMDHLPSDCTASGEFLSEDEFRANFPGIKPKQGLVYKKGDSYHVACLAMEYRHDEWVSYRFISDSIWQQVKKIILRNKPYKGHKYHPSLVAEALFFHNLLLNYDENANYEMIASQMENAFPQVKNSETAKKLVEKSRSGYEGPSFTILGQKITREEILHILTMTDETSNPVWYFLNSLLFPDKEPVEIIREQNDPTADPEKMLEIFRFWMHI